VLVHQWTQIFRKRRFDGHCFVAYIGLYGLGRGFIEILKTETHMIGNVKISMVLGFACFIAAAVILIAEYVTKKPDPDRLYVNRLLKAAHASEAAAFGKAVTDTDDVKRRGQPRQRLRYAPENRTTAFRFRKVKGTSKVNLCAQRTGGLL
jgi:hypothetical protein